MATPSPSSRDQSRSPSPGPSENHFLGDPASEKFQNLASGSSSSTKKKWHGEKNPSHSKNNDKNGKSRTKLSSNSPGTLERLNLHMLAASGYPVAKEKLNRLSWEDETAPKSAKKDFEVTWYGSEGSKKLSKGVHPKGVHPKGMHSKGSTKGGSK